MNENGSKQVEGEGFKSSPWGEDLGEGIYFIAQFLRIHSS